MRIRILSAAIIICMLLTVLPPVGVLAAEGDLPTALTLEPSAENGLPASISLVKTGSVYSLYLPGNVDVSTCFFSWADGLPASDGATQYESGMLPVPAPGQTKTFTFTDGSRTASFTVTTYQGSAQLKPIFIEIDESLGTIAAMNNDPNHNTECTGVIYIDGVRHDLPKMKGRGNYAWSQSKDKRAYNVTLGKKVNLLGINSGKTKKWSFLANVCDHSLLRDKVGYDVGYQLGIAYDSASADVWMNGEYQGVYLITPKTDSFVSDDGFLIENDNNTEPSIAEGGDPSFTLQGLYGSGGTDTRNNWDNRITVKKIGDNLLLNSEGLVDESEANLTAVTGTIQSYTQDVWDAIRSADGYNSKGVYYADYIDLETFAKMYLVLEYAKDYDVCSGSNFMHRDGTAEADKLYAGPVWDLDSSLGCTQENGSLRLGSEISMTTGYGWFIRNIYEYKTSIYKALGRHRDFMDEVYRVYDEYREVFDRVPENVTAFADEIADSAMMNFQKVDPVDNYNVARYYNDTVKNPGTQYEQHYRATTNSKTDWPIYVENLKTFTVARSLFFRNNLVPSEAPDGEPGVDLAPFASVYSDYTASWENLNGINDPSFEPEASNVGIGLGWGNWSQTTGSEHYVGYIWSQPVNIDALDIYWYDDGGGTRVPSAYRMQYKDADGVWHPVNILTDYSETTALNQYNRILIEPITATDLRLIMTTASNASGIYRFKVYEQAQPVDRTELEAAVAAAEALDLSAYTEESAAALQNALQEAAAVLADEDASQEEVDAAAQALTDAVAALEEKPPVNDTALEAVLSAAEAITPDAYTDETSAALESAIAAGRQLLSSPTATQEDVDAAVQALIDAIAALEEKPEPLRLDALRAALSAAESISPDAYLGETFLALEDAILAAKQLLSSPTASQKEVDDAAQALIDAIAALQEKPEPVRLEALRAAVSATEAISPDAYTGETISALEDAIAAAEQLLSSTSASQAEVDAAAQALIDAIAALQEKPEPVRLEALRAAVSAAEAISSDAYTGETISALEDAVIAANSLLSSPTASQEDVDAAVQALIDAITALEEKPEPVCLDALCAALSAAEAIAPGAYTDETAAALESAIAAGEQLLSAPTASQTEVDAAAHALIDAIAALEKKTNPVQTDKAGLALAIEAAEAVDADKYTDESVAALNEALTKAKAVDAKADATQEEVDAAKDALEAAVAALEKAGGQPFLFDDVKDESKFYFDPVYWAYYYEPQITAGKTATLFGPNDACTRGHVVTFLYRSAGSPAIPEGTENPFTDVEKGKFYYDAVLWAVANGITDGMTDTTFVPGNTCTRGQIVTFLWRSANRPKAATQSSPFTDVREGSFYYDAVLWAVEAGITDGKTETGFAPSASCTRAEIVTFLYRSRKE